VLDQKWVSLRDWQEQIVIIRDMVNFGDRVLAATSKRKQTAAHKGDVLALVNWLVESVRTGFEASEEDGVIRFKARAHTLLDAMKLQLAEAIVLAKSYRDCEHCGKPFEVTPQVNRADRVYCSDNCRVKAYQRRRKQAIKMREDGDTLREIAKVLGSDMSTIKKWVGETNKEK
jgi:predicted nucleic acid-binding Zn ribbon protein